jgi:hypothetical protein
MVESGQRHTPATLLPKKQPRVTTELEAGLIPSRSKRCGKKTNLFSFPGNDPRFFGWPNGLHYNHYTNYSVPEDTSSTPDEGPSASGDCQCELSHPRTPYLILQAVPTEGEEEEDGRHVRRLS